MKKFFKQLAIVLALALVLTSVGSVNAQAATDRKVTKSSKYLFVGGATGTKADGTGKSTIGYAYKVKVSPKLADGEKLSLKTDDKAVAKVTKGNRIIAVSIGNTTVTAFVTDAAGTKTEVGKIAVRVKANAKEVTIKGAPESGIVGLGADILTLTAEQKNARGTASDDVAELTIDEKYKDIATIKDGKVTTLKTGEFEVVARTYQNSKLTGTTATATLKLKAVVNMLTATQKSNKEFNLTFDSKVKDIVKAEDFYVYYLTIDKTEFKVPVEKFTVDSQDNSKAVLQIWTAMVPKTEYFIKYKDQAPLSVTAATLELKEATKLVITTASVEVQKDTTLGCKVLDANGIEIPDASGYVSFSIVGTSDVCSLNSPTIYFWDKNKSAQITAMYYYTYYDENGQYKEVKLTADTVTVVSKDPAPFVLSSLKWTIGDVGTPVATFNQSGYTQRTFVAKNDGNKELVFDMDLSNGASHEYYKSDNASNVNDLWFTSSDKNVLVMDSNRIVPVGVGSTQILIYKGEKFENDGKVPVAVIPVIVKDDKEARTIVTDFISRSKLNTSVGGDSVSIGVLVKDQYGDPYNGAGIICEYASGTVSSGIFTAPESMRTGTDGKATFIINKSVAIAGTPEGSLSLRFKVDGSKYNLNTIVPLTLKNDTTLMGVSSNTFKAEMSTGWKQTTVCATGTAVNGKFVLLGQTPGNANYVNDYKITFNVNEFSRDGFFIGTKTTAAKPYGTDTTVGNIVYKLYKGASEVNKTTYPGSGYIMQQEYLDDGAVFAMATKAVSSGAVKKGIKLGAGVYTIRLYQVQSSGDPKDLGSGATATFTIADNQPSLSVAQRVFEIRDILKPGIIAAYPIDVTYNTVGAQTIVDKNTGAAPADLTYSVKEGSTSSVITQVIYTVHAGDFDFDVVQNTGYVVRKIN